MKPGPPSVDLAREGILLTDEAWVVTSANGCARELLHCSQPELPGIDFWDAVQPGIAEQQRQVADMALKLAGEHVFVAHMRFEGQSVEYTFTRRPGGILVHLRDVTAAQKVLQQLDDAERRNRVLFDYNPNAMWVFDLDTQKILAANTAAIHFYGIPHKRFLTIKMGALFPDGEGAALMHGVSLKEDHPAHVPAMLLCKQKRLDGQMLLVELAANRVEWQGRPCMLVSIADISGRHLADTHLRRLNVDLEQQLEQRTSDLQAASRDLEAFEQAMSNDLKDPLHVLNGFARTLAEKYAGVLDKQGRHYVERIQASTRQLAKLVDDLRMLTRLARMPLNLQDVDVAPLCRLMIEELQRREPGRDVLLEVPDNLWLAGDRGLLAIALGHLLDNAWKFTAKRDQAWIRIAIAPGALPGEKVLSVSDNGAGFDTAYGDRLFTAFQRLHSSADFPGNGLGLVIVKRIAVRLGGRVWAESQDGSGASFYLALPPLPVDEPGEDITPSALDHLPVTEQDAPEFHTLRPA